jgi:hypothetical protein
MWAQLDCIRPVNLPLTTTALRALPHCADVMKEEKQTRENFIVWLKRNNLMFLEFDSHFFIQQFVHVLHQLLAECLPPSLSAQMHAVFSFLPAGFVS